MSDTQAKATQKTGFEGLPNALARELVDMARHTSYADGVVQQVQEKLDAHYDKLLEALKAIQDLNPFDFQPPIKYSEKVGEMVRAAIQSAEEQPNARNQNE